MVDLVLGGQWGDEGKGKLVDILAGSYDYVVRCAGGNNAGHTVVKDGKTYDFHSLPSGMVHANCINVIGHGVVLHVPQLKAELEKNLAKGFPDGWKERLKISDRAHLVFDMHQAIDGLEEVSKGTGSIGTTRKGIGPTYASKAARINLRVCDLVGRWDLFASRFKTLAQRLEKQHIGLKVDVEAELTLYKTLADWIRPMVCDTIVLLGRARSAQKKILVEGANAAMLDIDMGTYPYVTSSSCTAGGACTGLGLPLKAISSVVGVVKAYTTRVGQGRFPTEDLGDVGNKLQTIGQEIGVTTGRKRRCGWLDLVIVKYTNLVNGYNSLCLTKLDVLDTFDEIKIGVAYRLDGRVLDSFPASMDDLERVEVEYITMPGWKTDISRVRLFCDLPPNAQAYVRKVAELTGVPVRRVGVGPANDAIIYA